jgi:hypothetical protein
MVLKLESKRCVDLASSTYIQWLKCKLWLPNTPSVGGEPFPSLLEAFLHFRQGRVFDPGSWHEPGPMLRRAPRATRGGHWSRLMPQTGTDAPK